MIAGKKIRTVEIAVMSRRGNCWTLDVPSVMEVCPNCEGRSSRLIGDECGVCDGKNVIEVADVTALAKYPRILKAWKRYDLQEQAAAWEIYGERVRGT